MNFNYVPVTVVFSALTLLVGQQEGHRPVINSSVKCWHGYLSGARCRLAYGPADATVTVSSFSKINIGFTFLIPAHPDSAGKTAVKYACVYVTVLIVVIIIVQTSRFVHHYVDRFICSMQ